jgi:hypothetical protein
MPRKGIQLCFALVCLLSFAATWRTSAAVCVQAPAGIVAWYRGEGNPSDFFGTHPGAGRNGVAFVPGLVGEAFQFDGTDDMIEVPEAVELHPPHITVEVWVNPANIKIGSRIVSQDLSGNSCDSPFYRLFTGSSRKRARTRRLFLQHYG